MASSIRVADIRVEKAGESAELSARVDAPGLGWRSRRLWVRMPLDLAPPGPHGDPFAAGLLQPAMAAGHDLVIDGPVSPSLLENLERIQSMLVDANAVNPWVRFHRVRVHTRVEDAAGAGIHRAALFFSGGVDSMYSLAQAELETGRGVDLLLFVHGFDVPLDAVHRAALVLQHLSGVAAMTGLRLAVMATNLKDFTDAALHWDMAHGAGLAFAGHTLGAHLDRLFISASDSHFRDGELSGTTTGLDPLWSRDGLAFVSIGGTQDRQMKAVALADAPFAHKHLVVCWKAPPGVVNCGRCAKCLRTMLQFLVVDALDRFETLPHNLPPELISGDSMLAEPYRIVHWRAMVDRLSQRPEWRPLADRIEQLIARSEQIKRPPRLGDLTTRDGRRVAAEWLRRYTRRHMPARARRRLLPVYRTLGALRRTQKTGW